MLPEADGGSGVDGEGQPEGQEARHGEPVGGGYPAEDRQEGELEKAQEGEGADDPRVAVLIPALDEEDALPLVLSAIPDWVSRVVVADNGSTDGTAQAATEHGAEVVHEPRRGYGSACLAGLRHLEHVGDPPGVIVFMDADGSDDPSGMGALVAPILEDRADMVLGVRKGEGGDVGTILPHARLGNRVVLWLVRILFGRSFQDLPPFRAISSAGLHRIEMDDTDWGWTLQMQLRGVRRGLRMEEIPVLHRRRREGVSKISGSFAMSLRVGAKMFWTLARERLRPPG